MVMTLSQLRKNKSSIRDKAIKSLETNKYQKEEDTRFWKLAQDASGNGSAVIRFLPPVKDELPWVKVFSYGFKSQTGRWYINESPSTIDLPDPVMELNRECYDSGDDAKKEEAKKRKRRTQFISNILVVKDPANPENEGKVFLFKYGKKIMDQILSKSNPEFEDDTPFDVWDIDEGANFRIRVKIKDKYPNYDSSEWMQQSALCSGDDDEMEKVINATYRLGEFHDPSKFKSYEDLKKDLDRVMSSSNAGTAADKASSENKQDDGFDLEAEVKKASAKNDKAVKKVEKKVEEPDDDDSLEDFKALLDDM